MKLGNKNIVKKELTRKEVSRRNMLKRLGISAAVAVILFVALLVVQSSILNQEAKVTCYQVKQELPSGTKLTEENLGTYLTLTNIPESLVPANYAYQPEELIGKFVNRNYTVKDIVTTDGVTDTSYIYKQNIKNPVEIAFSASSISSVVGGTIREGDYVNFIGLTPKMVKADGEKETQKFLEDYTYVFKHVYIDRAYGGEGQNLANIDAPTGDEQATMFIVVLEEEDQDAFVEMLSNSDIYLTKLIYDTDQDYQDFIKKANKDTGYYGSLKGNYTDKNIQEAIEEIEAGNTQVVDTNPTETEPQLDENGNPIVDESQVDENGNPVVEESQAETSESNVAETPESGATPENEVTPEGGAEQVNGEEPVEANNVTE